MGERGVNKVIQMGRLGADPEVRYTQEGTAICTFSLAMGESWKDRNTGEQREKTEWSRCVAFRRVAEVLGEHLTKGSRIYIEGHLQTRSWEKDGERRYTTEVVIDEFNFVSDAGRRDSGQDYSRPQDVGNSAPPGADDDDIPF